MFTGLTTGFSFGNQVNALLVSENVFVHAVLSKCHFTISLIYNIFLGGGHYLSKNCGAAYSPTTMSVKHGGELYCVCAAKLRTKVCVCVCVDYITLVAFV